MSKAQTGSFDSLPTEQPYPGISRQSLNTVKSTITRYTFKGGAAFPLHRHPQEQLTFIEAGDVEFVAGEGEGELAAGSYFVVPPDLEHSIKAGPNGASILAIVIPGRESTDAYEVVDQ